MENIPNMPNGSQMPTPSEASGVTADMRMDNSQGNRGGYAGDDSGSDDESYEDASSFPWSPSSVPPPRRSTREAKPRKEWWVPERAPTHMAWLTQAQLRRDPRLHARFQEAMEKELRNMAEYDAWDLRELPRGRGVKPLKSIWVHTVKKKDGVETPKSRLVANGSQQRYWIDYTESFSTVAKPASSRTIFALALQEDATLHQSDIVAAYLNGSLEEGEEVWMTQPEGFEVHGRDGRPLYCKLKKAIYGLKQAGRRWNQHLNEFMEAQGFKRSIWDQCVYFRGAKEDMLIVTVVVDDLTTFYRDADMFAEFWRALAQEFKIKDLGEVEQYVGIKVA